MAKSAFWVALVVVVVVLVWYFGFYRKGKGRGRNFKGGPMPFPGRQQWDDNGGYCGEVSMISTGLYFGQYFSQFDMRAIASKGPYLRRHPRLGHSKNKNDGSCNGPPGPSVPCALQQCQLLIGVNDTYTANQVRLNSIPWDPNANPNPQSLLVWMKQHLLAGHSVIFTVFVNQNIFFGDEDPCAGQCDYDHIVIAERVDSTHPNDGKYYGDDVLWFSDNGEYPDGSPQFYFSTTFDNFPATRADANDPDGTPYSLNNNVADPDTCPYQTIGSYAIAITGVQGASETLPVKVTTNKNYEQPEIDDGGNTRPAPMSLVLNVTVSNLIPNKNYTLYVYDDETKVPTSNFNAYAKNAAKIIPINIKKGSTYTMTQNIQNNQKVIYRAVPSP